MKKSKSGLVRRSTVIITSIVFFFIGGYVGGMLVLVYLANNSSPGAVALAQPIVTNDGQQEEIKEHIKHLEDELAQTPNKADLWIELGNIYFDSDQAAPSVSAYQKALALNPRNPDVWTDMGVMYRRLGDYQKALESFDKAIAIDPAHEVALYNKGIVALHDLDKPELALKAWEALLAQKPQAKTPDGRLIQEIVAETKKTFKAQPVILYN